MIEQFKQKIDNKINKDIYPKFVQYSKLEIIEKDIKEAINTLNNTVKDHSKQIRQIRDNSMKRNKLLLSISEDNNNIKTVPNTDRIKVKDVPQKMNKDNNNTNTNDISKIQIFNNTNNTTNYSNEISLLRKEIKEMKKAQSNNTVVDISKNMKDIESVKKIIPMFDQDITKIKKDVLAHEKNFNVIQYNFDNMKKLYDKVLIEFPKIEEIIMNNLEDRNDISLNVFGINCNKVFHENVNIDEYDRKRNSFSNCPNNCGGINAVNATNNNVIVLKEKSRT